MSEVRRSKVVAIIQARMGSTRLPGKVMAPIQGRPMLRRVIERTRAAATLDEVIVATTTQPADDAIVDFCAQLAVGCFRGSEEDVLDRYYRAACRHNADVVVRITSDCPLIDPSIVDKIVRAFFSADFDYVSNTLIRTYPRGLDTEVMTFTALEQAYRMSSKSYQRSHVTPYIYENPKQFRILSVTADENYGDFRWTIDTPEDLSFVRAVYDRLGAENAFLGQILKLMKSEPQLAEINGSVVQKALHEG